MQSTFDFEQLINENLLKNIYEGWQKLKAGLSLAHKNLSTEIKNALFPHDVNLQKISPETWTILQQRVDDVIHQDWQDAKDGVYPLSVLFDTNWQEFFLTYINIWLDSPAIWSRRQKGDFQEFTSEIDLTKYPQYYRRNFHYQSGGYLTDNSADLYDLQVDILFNGIADAMRRRVLKPLKQGLASFNNSQTVKILDVACGTGRTLKFLRSSFPHASLYGLDLSSAYLRKANQLLSQNPQELPQLIEGNAESLPYGDNYFEGVTNVFLFHELPNAVRQKVINEFFRVLKPNGTLVIADSIQLSDSPELEAVMINFPLTFHEPFYNDYIRDDIDLKLLEAGFQNIKTEVYAASKYWIASKPDS